jgi:CheY-like chemotaxis protein
VLVVEDDAVLCDGLVLALEREGYLGIKALNGRQALHVLENLPARPGLILLDLAMPEMSGLRFREAQLADRELCAIPVVAMLGSAWDASACDLPSAAATLRKPVDTESLLQTVAAHYLHPSGFN